MELSTAVDLIDTLAQGIDPTTGDVLPEDSMYNKPPIIRALFLVGHTLRDIIEQPRPMHAGDFDNEQAVREGWSLFDDGVINALHEVNRFGTDTEAIMFVVQQAQNASEYHRLALALVGRPDPRHMKDRTQSDPTTMPLKRNVPPNTGKPWTSGDDQELRYQYTEGRTVKEIAKNFGRTRWAIEARLVKIGLLTLGGRPVA